MRNAKKHHADIRRQGEWDFHAGRPIGAFYDMPLKRHTELERGSYEIGWRGAKADARAKRMTP